MSFTRRQVTRRDLAEPAIVAALEAAGCRVYKVLLVDLLVQTPAHASGEFSALEVKTEGLSAHKAERTEQQAFQRETGTVTVRTPQEALRALHLIEFELGT